jgi:hypothetical protein
MSNNYSKSLAAMKELMPRGYQKEILKKSVLLKEWHVKQAFSGKRPVPDRYMRIIYRIALRLVDKRAEQIEKDKYVLREIQLRINSIA